LANPTRSRKRGGITCLHAPSSAATDDFLLPSSLHPIHDGKHWWNSRETKQRAKGFQRSGQESLSLL